MATPPRRLRLALVGVVAAAMLLIACQAGTSPGAGDDQEPAAAEPLPVAFGVSVSTFRPAQAPYSSLPQALGFWREEGLEAQVLGFPGGSAAAQALDAGQLDAGIANTASLFSGVSQGKDFTAYFTQVTKNFFIPQVPEESDIQTIEDFEGKRIGVASLESGAVPVVRAMLDFVGLDPDKDADFVAVGTGSSALTALESGEVQVIALWDSAHALIERLGLPLRPVANDFFRELGFSQAVFTNEETLTTNPEVQVGVARGIAKAMVFARENPEAAVKVHWQVYPDSKPTGVDEGEALAQAVEILQLRQQSTEPVDGVWGMATEQQVRDQMEMLLRGGQLSEPIDIEQIWTDELLEEINNFDEEAVRELARTYEVKEEEEG